MENRDSQYNLNQNISDFPVENGIDITANSLFEEKNHTATDSILTTSNRDESETMNSNKLQRNNLMDENEHGIQRNQQTVNDTLFLGQRPQQVKPPWRSQPKRINTRQPMNQNRPSVRPNLVRPSIHPNLVPVQMNYSPYPTIFPTANFVQSQWHPIMLRGSNPVSHI